VNLYAESSAVLAWLLDEPDSEAVRRALVEADFGVASEVTLAECDRVILRAVSLDRLAEGDAADRHARLSSIAAHWTVLGVSQEVVDRARRPFPVEPIGTLDALHLASALVARRALPELVLLSLDWRVRRCGQGLAFELLPPGD
jgi:predicted nucleic acid-binding protein